MSGNPVPAEALGLADVWSLLRRRWMFAVASCLIILLVGLVGMRMLPVVYEARAALAFDKTGDAVEFAAAPDRFFNDREQWINTRREAMVAQTVLARVVTNSALRESPVYAQVVDPVALLARRVSATTVKNTLQVVLVLQDEDPRRAEHALQVLVEEFLNDQTRLVQERHAGDMAFLAKQIDEAQARHRQMLDEERDFRDRHGVSFTTQERNPLIRLHESLGERKAGLVERHAAVVSLMGQMSGADALPDPAHRREAYLRIDRISQFTTIGALVSDLNALVSKEATLMVKYGDRHPRLIQARQELASKRTQLDQAIASTRTGIEAEAHQIADQLAALEQAEANVRQDLARQRDAQGRLEALQAAGVAQAKAIAQMEEALARRRIEVQMADNRIQLIDPPRAGGEPVGLRRTPMVAALVLLSLVGGMIVAVVAEVAVGRLSLPGAAANAVGAADLGQVRLGAPRSLPMLNEPLLIEESYRALRNRLQATGGQRSQVVVVVSPDPEDGRTTLALRLAATHAMAGIPTLLVEGDLSGETLADAVGAQGARGLADILSGVPDVAPVETGIEHLLMMPIGAQLGNPGDALAGPILSEWLQHCRTHFALVIVDTPALRESADALVWASQADGLLLAVSDRVTRQRLDEAMRGLMPWRSRLLGVVQVLGDA